MSYLNTLAPYDLAVKLVEDFGFSIIPLADRGSPYETDANGNFILNSEGKRKKTSANPRLTSWRVYQTRLPTEGELDQWFTTWPNANIGILCGRLSNLLVIDCDSPQAIQWHTDHCVRTPWVVETEQGFHFYYKYPTLYTEEQLQELWTRVKLIRVDVQKEGRYVCGFGSVHSSGKLYTLHAMLDWEDVPEFCYSDTASATLQANNEKLYKRLLNTDTLIYTGLRNDILTSYAGYLFSQRRSKEDVLIAVNTINQQRCRPVLPETETARIVNSILRGDQQRHPERHPVVVDNNDVQLIDLENDPLLQPWPEKFLHPGGLMEEIMAYEEASSVCSMPVYNLIGAFLTMSHFLGYRVVGPTGLANNFYSLVIGPSGSGKDVPATSLFNICSAVKPYCTALDKERKYTVDKTLITDFASPASLMSALSKFANHPVATILIDEFGQILQEFKAKNGAKNGTLALLTKLYTHYNKPMTKTYADFDSSLHIPWNCVNVFGTTTKDEIYRNLNKYEISSGFGARFLMMEANANDRYIINENPNKTVPSEIIRYLLNIWWINGAGDTKNGDQFCGIEAAQVIGWHDEDARKLFFDYMRQCKAANDTKYYSDKSHEGAIESRKASMALKLSVLDAFSIHSNPDEAFAEGITKDRLEFYIEFIEEVSKRLYGAIETNMYENIIEESQQKVSKVIKKFMEKQKKANEIIIGASLRDIYRTLTQTRKFVEEIKDTLLVREEIAITNQDDVKKYFEKKNKKCGRNKPEYYVLIKDIDGLPINI